MRWLARIFANAVARRVASLLVVAALAWLGLGEAKAANCSSPSDGCTKPQAYEICMQAVATKNGQSALYANRCADYKSNKMWMVESCYIAYGNCGPTQNGWAQQSNLRYYYASECPAGEVWNDKRKACQTPCNSRQPASTLFLPPGGSTACNNGCEAKYTWMGADSQGRETTMANYTGQMCSNDSYKNDCNAKNPGGSTPPSWVWNGYLGVCQPINTECPADQKATPDGKCTNNDNCPIGHVLNASGVCVKKGEECPAGMTGGIDGLCTADNDKNKCPTGQAKGKDGTCKPDKNNDGIPDSDQDPDDPNNNEDGKQFGGGDSCNVPPNCAGDPIMCGQARIQWRIDCNTRKQANISGGVCNNMPVCTGDGCKPMEYQQLLMQWRTACAVEKLAKGGTPSDGSGEGNGTVPNPDTSGVGDGVLEGALGEHGEGDPDGAFTDGSEGGAPGGQPGGTPGSDGLDSQGYGWSRSCPTPPAVDLLGATITFDIGPFCNWMAIGGWLVLIMASLLSVRIMASGGSA